MSIDKRTLEQLQVRLLVRRAELRQRRDRIGQDLARQNEPLTIDSSDRAIQLENDEPLQAIGHAAVEELRQIDAALDRMSRGLYGTCRACGEEIAPARLAAVPQAVTCGSCEQG